MLSVEHMALLNSSWFGISLIQVMPLHYGFPSRHVEPCLVRLHHPYRAAKFHGRERPNAGKHRDIGLHRMCTVPVETFCEEECKQK